MAEDDELPKLNWWRLSWVDLAAVLMIVLQVLMGVFKDELKNWFSGDVVRWASIVLAAILCVYGIGLLRRHRKPKDLNELLLPAWRRIARRVGRAFGLIVAIAAGAWCLFLLGVTLAPVATSLAKDAGRAISVFFPAPPLVEIKSTQNAVRRGESVEIEVTVNGEALPDSYKATWTPGILSWQPNRGKGRFEPDEQFVKAGESKEVTVQVVVQDQNLKEVGKATCTFTVVYAPIIKLAASADQVLESSPVEFVVSLDGAAPPSGHRFSWVTSDDKKPIETTLPRSSFVPRPLGAGTSQKDFEVQVEVFDPSGKPVGSQTTRIVVRARRPYFLAIVLDGSKRMGQGDMKGKTWMEAAKETIDGELDVVEASGGKFGMWSFGDSKSTSEGMPCERVNVVFPIGANLSQAQNDLKSVSVGGEDAPLIRAISTAMKSLAAYRTAADARITLLIITGGDDTCNKVSVADYLQRLKDALKSSGSPDEGLTVKVRTFTIAAAKTKEDADSWLAVSRQVDFRENPDNLLLVVRDTQQLESAVDSFLQLHSPDEAVRGQAGEILAKLFSDQGLLIANKSFEEFRS